MTSIEERNSTEELSSAQERVDIELSTRERLKGPGRVGGANDRRLPSNRASFRDRKTKLFSEQELQAALNGAEKVDGNEPKTKRVDSNDAMGVDSPAPNSGSSRDETDAAETKKHPSPASPFVGSNDVVGAPNSYSREETNAAETKRRTASPFDASPALLTGGMAAAALGSLRKTGKLSTLTTPPTTNRTGTSSNSSATPTQKPYAKSPTQPLPTPSALKRPATFPSGSQQQQQQQVPTLSTTLTTNPDVGTIAADDARKGVESASSSSQSPSSSSSSITSTTGAAALSTTPTSTVTSSTTDDETWATIDDDSDNELNATMAATSQQQQQQQQQQSYLDMVYNNCAII